VRYATAAGCATRRAQRAFFEHRKARLAGLIRPAAEVPERENGTNDFAAVAAPPDPRPAATSPAATTLTAAPAPAPKKCTNDFLPTDPLATLRARLDRSLGGPGPRRPVPDERGPAAALRALGPHGVVPRPGQADLTPLGGAPQLLAVDAAGPATPAPDRLTGGGRATGTAAAA
jgi:hypothetical protein